MAKFKAFLLCSFLLLGTTLFAQEKLKQLEDSIYHYRDLSFEDNPDSVKLMYNDAIVGFWKQALELEGSQAYAFSKLSRFSILKDRDVTMVTWNLELNDFNNTFYGVTGYRENRVRRSKVLIDRGMNVAADRNQIYDSNNWPGAVYYKMVAFKRKNGYSYLLLGWRGENRMENFKVADIMSPGAESLNFGLPILTYRNGKRINRFAVHYPSSLNYSMQYDEKEQRFFYNRLDLIDETKGFVFNNLTPTYTFDAFKYKGGKWIKQEDIEVLKP